MSASEQLNRAISTSSAEISSSTDKRAGLTWVEAERRLQQYGENALAEHHISALQRLLRFFWGPIPWMIEMAIGAISPSSC
jgi:H+-transporting ATPase